MITLAAGVKFVVGAGVDLRCDVLGPGVLGAGATVWREGDGGEDCVGGAGTAGADGDGVGAEGGDGCFREEAFGPRPGGEDDVGCGESLGLGYGFAGVDY